MAFDDGAQLNEFEYLRQLEPNNDRAPVGDIVDQTFGLHPYLDAVWTPPTPDPVGGFAPYYSEEVREIAVIAVLRDRRGGMAWGRLTMVVTGPAGPPG